MEKGPVQLAKPGRSVTSDRVLPSARRTLPVRPADENEIVIDGARLKLECAPSWFHIHFI